MRRVRGRLLASRPVAAPRRAAPCSRRDRTIPGARAAFRRAPANEGCTVDHADRSRAGVAVGHDDVARGRRCSSRRCAASEPIDTTNGWSVSRLSRYDGVIDEVRRRAPRRPGSRSRSTTARHAGGAERAFELADQRLVAHEGPGEQVVAAASRARCRRRRRRPRCAWAPSTHVRAARLRSGGSRCAASCPGPQSDAQHARSASSR